MIALLAFLIIILSISSVPFLKYRMNLRNRFGYWLLAIYNLVLIGSVVVYFFIPKEGFLEVEDIPWEGYEPVAIFLEVVENQTPIEEFTEYLDGTWEFDITGEENLSLGTVATDFFNYPVIIEQTEDTGKITIDFYRDMIKFDGDDLFQVNVALESNQLIFYPPRHVQYSFGQFDKEFPFTQFTGGASGELTIPASYILNGEAVFYITVPEDVELTIDPEIFAEWIN